KHHPAVSFISNKKHLASGGNAMRLQRRFLLPLLVTSCFAATVSMGAEEHDHDATQSQAAQVTTVQNGLWSASSTWAGGTVPKAGDIVSIAAGTEVVLDLSPPALHGMNLEGKLSFASDKDLELTTEWILMRGALEIGTASKPHTRNAT